MKRQIAIFLSALLLCLAFTGCKTESASQKRLWVVTDLGYEWSSGGERDLSEERAKVDFQAILDYFGGLPEDMEVELEILPVKDADLNARLTRIKTEILAGGGPDVFLLSCNDPVRSIWNQEKLFPNPEKAMYSGFFLPLDEYIENAEFMEWDKLTPVVMEAGRTEEGQMILPFCYNTYVILAEKSTLGEKTPDNWDEAVGGENPVYQKGYAWAASAAFPSVFPRIVDNRTEELSITKEELLHRVEQCLSCPEYGWEDEYPAVFSLIPEFDNGRGNVWEGDLEKTTFLPMRNTEGGYSAYVTYYGAVNRNTEFPQEAFTILDMFLSKPVLKRVPFGGVVGAREQGKGIYLFSNFRSIPVHEELYLGVENTVDRLFVSEETFEIFDGLRGEITDVYFPSDIERTIGEMYGDYYYSMDTWSEEDREGLEKLVSDTYDRVWMMLGES